LSGSALLAPNLREILIADENCSLKVRECFIVDFEGTSIVGYFGDFCEVTIGRLIRKLSEHCFTLSTTLSSVIFDSDSQLSCIENHAFSDCSSLSSIFIPSSVETICHHCFNRCKSLSTITFEYGSKLSCIKDYAFQDCSSLSSICIPGSVAKICKSCFCVCKSLSTITFESGSKLSCIDNFSYQYCSSLSSICIPSSVETICQQCFNDCESLATITFESGSTISCIERGAFDYCSSIYIPSSFESILQEYPLILGKIALERGVHRARLGIDDSVQSMVTEPMQNE
jgi:hypothetical protein